MTNDLLNSEICSTVEIWLSGLIDDWGHWITKNIEYNKKWSGNTLIKGSTRINNSALENFKFQLITFEM